MQFSIRKLLVNHFLLSQFSYKKHHFCYNSERIATILLSIVFLKLFYNNKDDLLLQIYLKFNRIEFIIIKNSSKT